MNLPAFTLSKTSARRRLITSKWRRRDCIALQGGRRKERRKLLICVTNLVVKKFNTYCTMFTVNMGMNFRDVSFLRCVLNMIKG